MSAEDFWEGAHSDSSGSSMIDDLEASTREFNLRSSLQTSLDSIGSPSEQQSKTASSLPPSPHATTFPPSIVLSPPSNQPEALPSVSGQYSDTAASSGSGTLRKRGSTISLLSGMSSSPVVAEALANSHVDPQEIRALKASLKGMLDLWTSSSSHQSLDSRLSRLQVFEAVADRVVVDHEQGIHDPED